MTGPSCELTVGLSHSRLFIFRIEAHAVDCVGKKLEHDNVSHVWNSPKKILRLVIQNFYCVFKMHGKRQSNSKKPIINGQK